MASTIAPGRRWMAASLAMRLRPISDTMIESRARRSLTSNGRAYTRRGCRPSAAIRGSAPTGVSSTNAGSGAGVSGSPLAGGESSGTPAKEAAVYRETTMPPSMPTEADGAGARCSSGNTSSTIAGSGASARPRNESAMNRSRVASTVANAVTRADLPGDHHSRSRRARHLAGLTRCERPETSGRRGNRSRFAAAGLASGCVLPIAGGAFNQRPLPLRDENRDSPRTRSKARTSW